MGGCLVSMEGFQRRSNSSQKRSKARFAKLDLAGSIGEHARVTEVDCLIGARVALEEAGTEGRPEPGPCKRDCRK